MVVSRPIESRQLYEGLDAAERRPRLDDTVDDERESVERNDEHVEESDARKHLQHTKRRQPGTEMTLRLSQDDTETVMR